MCVTHHTLQRKHCIIYLKNIYFDINMYTQQNIHASFLPLMIISDIKIGIVLYIIPSVIKTYKLSLKY